MKRKLMQISLFIFSIGVAVTLMGCGGTIVGDVKPVGGEMYVYDKTETWVPAWVMGKLPHTERGGYRDVLQAVGESTSTRNPELSRRRAISASRAELARILGVKVQNLIKEWTEEHTDIIDDSGSSILFYEEVGRQVTNADLVGSQVDIVWVHPKTDMTYALVSISRSEAVEEAIKLARQHAERFKKRQQVRKWVDDAMTELDETLKKTEAGDYYNESEIIGR